MLQISFYDNELRIDFSNSIKFPYKIKDIKNYRNVVLVILKVPHGTADNRNVYAVSTLDKRILWQIQEPDKIYQDSPYMNFVDNMESIIVGNWNGISYEINEQDGTIIRGIQTK